MSESRSLPLYTADPFFSRTGWTMNDFMHLQRFEVGPRSDQVGPRRAK